MFKECAEPLFELAFGLRVGVREIEKRSCLFKGVGVSGGKVRLEDLFFIVCDGEEREDATALIINNEKDDGFFSLMHKSE